MTIALTTGILGATVLGFLVFALGANVTRLRALRGRDGGPQDSTAPDDRLFIAVRAHGNASEYVPTLIVLFLLVGWLSPGWWSITLVVAATTSRLAHAYGILSSQSLAVPTMAREAAAAGTYVFGVALAVTAAVAVL